MSDYKEEISFWYTAHDCDREIIHLHFDFDEIDGIHAAKFHRMCKQFARMIGYAEETVENYFGADQYDDLE